MLLLRPAARARADQFSTYQAAGSFAFPAAPSSFDVLPDGRIVAIIGPNLFRESTAGSHSFVDLGPLPGNDVPGWGAAFIRVSPDGTRIAVGNNGGTSGTFEIGVFTITPLVGTWFAANHFDAEWLDGRYLAVTSGDFGFPSVVTALDTQSPNPTSPSNVTLVTNIAGASSGVAVDAAGNLFTANGYQYSGPSTTGSVYAIRHSAWTAAQTSGVPVNFETQGVPIVDLLSGFPLGFDAEGNLLVGGGDSFGGSGDVGYFGLVRAGAISTALAGGGLINVSNPANVRKLDPDPAADDLYSVGANRSRSELYAINYASATAYVYKAPAPAVPAMPAPGLLALAGLILIAGIVAQARRRAS